MLIETHKISALYFVKNPYRRDLDKFCTTPLELIKEMENNKTSYTPIIYEVQFFLATPKFKKLSKAQLKKIFEFNLGEKISGRSKDLKYYNAANKHERAYLPKRKSVTTYKKKKQLAAGMKILNAAQMRQFKAWIKDGNATEVEPGLWLEQSTQYKKQFDFNELQKFFKREYL
jgi:hypothetical protein